MYVMGMVMGARVRDACVYCNFVRNRSPRARFGVASRAPVVVVLEAKRGRWWRGAAGVPKVRHEIEWFGLLYAAKRRL